MTVLFTHEIHASKIKGRYYNKGGVISHKALLNYLNTCPKGILIARCVEEDEFEEGVKYLDLELGENSDIKMAPIKEFSLKSFISNIRIVNSAIKSTSCFLIRLPGLTGLFVGIILLFRRKKYGVELAGDLREGLNEVYLKPSLLKRLQFSIFEKLNKLLIRKSIAVGYRSNLLSSKYPNKSIENHFIFSGAQIFSEDTGNSKPPAHYLSSPFQLLYLGRISPEKGLNSLLHAIVLLKNENLNFHLTVIGDGNQFDQIENTIKKLRIENLVTLKGKITDKNIIHNYMDQSHLFIIPSLTEGMPRALIEAMARGMVAIGSNIGGIPEVLGQEFLFDAEDSTGIANKIKEMINNPTELSNISKQNLIVSQKHWFCNLKPIKDAFWEKVISNK